MRTSPEAQENRLSCSVSVQASSENATSISTLLSMQSTSLGVTTCKQGTSTTPHRTRCRSSQSHTLQPTEMFQKTQCYTVSTGSNTEADSNTETIKDVTLQCSLECLEEQNPDMPEGLHTKAAKLICKVTGSNSSLIKFQVRLTAQGRGPEE